MLTNLPGPRRLYQQSPWSYVMAFSAVALLTGLIYLVHPSAGIAAVSMLYLLVVIAAALFLGSQAAILAAIAGFLATDWFFTEPRNSFTVQNPSEWVALIVFLITGRRHRTAYGNAANAGGRSTAKQTTNFSPG